MTRAAWRRPSSGSHWDSRRGSAQKRLLRRVVRVYGWRHNRWRDHRLRAAGQQTAGSLRHQSSRGSRFFRRIPDEFPLAILSVAFVEADGFAVHLAANAYQLPAKNSAIGCARSLDGLIGSLGSGRERRLRGISGICRGRISCRGLRGLLGRRLALRGRCSGLSCARLRSPRLTGAERTALRRSRLIAERARNAGLKSNHSNRQLAGQTADELSARADVDKPPGPVRLVHGVFVFLAEKMEVAGVLREILDAAGEMPVLAVVEADGPNILVASPGHLR